VGIAEVGTAEAGTVEVGTAEVGTVEVGTVEVGIEKFGTDQVRDFVTRPAPSIPFGDSLFPTLEQFERYVAIHGADPRIVAARSIPSAPHPFIAPSQR
jgi:hypothetical protein